LQANQDDKVRRGGDIIARAVERATDLVKRTLDFAREDPSAPLRESMKLRAVAEEAAEQARASRPGIELHNRVPETMTVQADRMHMLRILGNLMRNAAEAGASHIQLAAVGDPDMITITLADDGPGLPEAIQRDLFRPFVGGGRRGGSGLGMAIAQDLIRAHGGEITLVSTGSTGTSFRLTLPQSHETPLA
jgi:signal transduction histidine kinase